MLPPQYSKLVDSSVYESVLEATANYVFGYSRRQVGLAANLHDW